MNRKPGLSVRLKLTLSYAGFLTLAGALLLGAVWVFLLRYVPEVSEARPGGMPRMPGSGPDRSDLEDAFTPKAAAAMASAWSVMVRPPTAMVPPLRLELRTSGSTNRRSNQLS